jgi:ABC-type protease/lipase transport system fused ATPase/permease subunit
LISHQLSALAACDHVLVLANGAQQGFGPRDQILRKVTRQSTAPTAPTTPSKLKVVSDTTDGGQK